MNWGLFAEPSGVMTDIGRPKLELQAMNIERRAKERGVSEQQIKEGLLKPNPTEHWMLPYLLGAPAGAALLNEYAAPDDVSP